MRVSAVVSLMSIVALVGCGGGGSTEAQTGNAGVRQSSAFNPSNEAGGGVPAVHRHTPQHSSGNQQQKKPSAPKHHESPSAPSSGVSQVTAEEFEQFSGTDKGNWEIAYGICAVTPEAQLAKEFHTEQNWAAIGHAYGQDYREPFNIAAEEGCMAALVDSSAEREAAFKMMEG